MKIEKTAQSRWNNEKWKNAGFGSVFSIICLLLIQRWTMAKSTNKTIWPTNVLPSLHSFHYGQAIFEGMKAYKGPNDEAFFFGLNKMQNASTSLQLECVCLRYLKKCFLMV